MSTTETFDEIRTAVVAAIGPAARAITVDTTARTLELTAPIDAVAIASLIGQALGRPLLAPAWAPTSVSLDQFRVALPQFGLREVFLAASVHGEWSPFDGLTLTDASIEVSERGGSFAGAFAGAARLDLVGLELRARIELPSQVFVLELADPNSAAAYGPQFLQQLDLVHLSTAAAPSGNAPKLEDLSVTGSVSTGEYVIHLVARDLLHLPALSLDLFAVDVRIGAANAVAVFAEASIAVGNDELVVDLLGSIDPEGWVLAGAARLPAGATLGKLASALAAQTGSTPPELPELLEEMELVEVDLTVDTAAELVAFHCSVDWPHDGAELDVTIEHRGDALTATGVFHFGDVDFQVRFMRDGAGGGVVIGSVSTSDGIEITLAELLGALGAGQVDDADAVSFSLKDAALAYGRPPKGLTGAPDNEWYVGADLGLGLDLAALRGLPLIGSMLPAGDSLRLAFSAVATSDWIGQHRATLAGSLPPTLQAIGVPPKPGVALSVELHLGDFVQRLGFGIDNAVASPRAVGGAPAGTAPLSTAPPAVQAPASPLSWYPVDRSFGPLHVARVGLAWDGTARAVTLGLDASLGAGGLSLSVQGFGARYGLDDHHLDVMLSGLGLAFKSGPIEMAGAFLNLDGDFAGKVLVKTEEFALSAMGAFKMIDGAPSAFVYGVLDYPIGGPPFFFVDGLAAGFGYNRRLIPPTIDKVRSFPLVADAVKAAVTPAGTTPPADPLAQLARLHDSITPALGEHFLAIGVKATSFKVVEGFVLLIVSIGEHPEIDILGSATYQSPPGDLGPLPAMVHVDLDLVARIPLDGSFLAIEAKLTKGSYVYSPLCQVSGGFAFYSWFTGEHAGDFVLSLGGYHPAFDRGHYPEVAPLELTFQVSSDVSIKGSAYLALTPSMIMAGASISAAVNIGSLEAGFSARLDFMLGWEPYFYAIDLDVRIYARWKCFSTHASAHLSLTGPDFAGHAHVEWSIFSFDVSFGSTKTFGPLPIDWTHFETSFLPGATSVCSVQVVSGLVDTVAGTDGALEIQRWVVLGSAFGLAVNTAVPATAVTLNGIALDDSAAGIAAALGIRPMNRLGTVTSTVHVALEELGDRGWRPATIGLIAEATSREFPTALWGSESFLPNLSSAATVTGLAGIRLATGPDHTFTGTSAAVSFDQLTGAGAPPARPWTASPPAMTFRDPDMAVAPRPALSDALVSLGFTEFDLSIGADFVEANAAGDVVVGFSNEGSMQVA